MKKTNRAFSLVELSIVILIIGVLMAAVGQGIELLQDAKLSSARQITQSSRVASLKDLALWLETTSEGSFATTEAVDDSAVSSWKDINPQAGGNNATSASTARPTYKDNAINGLPALLFDGTNDYMSFTNPAFLGTPDSMTVFFVAKTSAFTDSQNVFNASGSVSVGLNGATTIVNCGRSFTTTAATVGSWTPTSATSLSTGQPIICSSQYNGSQVQGWTNKGGADTAESASGNIASSSGGTATVGATTSTSGFFNGHIAEIIIFNRALSTKDRNAVESYLSKKWNIKLI
jgi:prepilin-type N-terminal cleavage/methylation domain-containing protein